MDIIDDAGGRQIRALTEEVRTLRVTIMKVFFERLSSRDTARLGEVDEGDCTRSYTLG